ncbi:hypothetical protein O6H91_20G072300 [Diphasiastrum complanatum]|uniref:Uncharacterized protein n=1 Tax=Diphasiastrum complanatum TaxID=34168 RepID=A0ACC2ARR4_DIPCM|nr:hypothetical protein O6H91_20G072300 [Diphasiastrum complanatum]
MGKEEIWSRLRTNNCVKSVHRYVKSNLIVATEANLNYNGFGKPGALCSIVIAIVLKEGFISLLSEALLNIVTCICGETRPCVYPWRENHRDLPTPAADQKRPSVKKGHAVL